MSKEKEMMVVTRQATEASDGLGDGTPRQFQIVPLTDGSNPISALASHCYPLSHK